MSIKALGFFGKTNPQGERVMDGGFRAETVEEFNEAVRMCVAEVAGTDAIEIVSHTNPEIIKRNGGFCQFAPDFQDALVFDSSKLTEVEMKRIEKFHKALSKFAPTSIVDVNV